MNIRTLRSGLLVVAGRLVRVRDARIERVQLLGRHRVTDAAFTFRMGAGFVGDVNRTHPATIEPALVDASAPPTLFGQAVLVDPTTQGVRPLVAGDQALTTIYGITVRPYPFQQSTASLANAQANLGAAAPPASGAIDVLRSGYIMVSVVGSPVKGGAVYIWTAAASGSHVQGGFEATDPTSNGMRVDAPKTYFNGAPDSTGIVELGFNI